MVPYIVRYYVRWVPEGTHLSFIICSIDILFSFLSALVASLSLCGIQPLWHFAFVASAFVASQPLWHFFSLRGIFFFSCVITR